MWQKNNLPEECKSCMEEDCYLCDTAGKRWASSVESELRAQRMLMVRAIERYRRKIQQIDEALERIQGGQESIEDAEDR